MHLEELRRRGMSFPGHLPEPGRGLSGDEAARSGTRGARRLRPRAPRPRRRVREPRAFELSQGRHDEAMRAFDRAAALGPDQMTQVENGRFTILVLQERWAERSRGQAPARARRPAGPLGRRAQLADRRPLSGRPRGGSQDGRGGHEQGHDDQRAGRCAAVPARLELDLGLVRRLSTPTRHLDAGQRRQLRPRARPSAPVPRASATAKRPRRARPDREPGCAACRRPRRARPAAAARLSRPRPWRACRGAAPARVGRASRPGEEDRQRCVERRAAVRPRPGGARRWRSRGGARGAHASGRGRPDRVFAPLRTCAAWRCWPRSRAVRTCARAKPLLERYLGYWQGPDRPRRRGPRRRRLAQLAACLRPDARSPSSPTRHAWLRPCSRSPR